VKKQRNTQNVFRVMALLAILLALFAPTSAKAISNATETICDSSIYDGAHAFGGNLDPIVAAMEDLGKYADVRVITIESYTTPSLDVYMDNMRKACPSWQALDGGFKNNMIIFIISVQQTDTGIFYGSEWDNPMDDNWTRIVADFMNPKFGDGDFTGGFKAGIKETYRLVDLKINPPVLPPSRVGDAPIIIDQKPPVDLSGLFRVLMVAIVLLACIVAIVFGYGWFTKHAEETAARRKAQQRAKLKKQAVTSGMAEWRGSVENVQTDITGLSQLVNGTIIERLQSSLREAERVYEQLLRMYNGLDNSAGDPNDDSLNEGQYDEITSAYTEVLNLLRRAQKELAEATDEVSTVKEQAEKAPEAMVHADECLEGARKAVDEMRTQGFSVEDAVLQPIEKLLASAKSSTEQKRPDLAYARAAEAETAAKQLSESLRALPARRQALLALMESLPAMISHAQELITAGRHEFDLMDDIYPGDALEAIEGNGSKSEQRVNAMMDAQKVLGTLTSSDHFDEAETLAEKIQAWAQEIDSMMRSITALHTNLDAAAKAVDKEVADATNDVKGAQVYLKEHRGEFLDYHDEALREAEAQLRIALKELDQKHPNPIIIVKAARAANQMADTVLEEARQDLEKRQRLLANVETAQREATRVLSKAEEYIEDHSSNVRRNAKAVLQTAKKNMETASETEDLERKIAFYEGAEDKARSAYNEAKKNVEEAEEEDNDSFSSSGSSPSVVIFNNTPSYPSHPSTNTWSAPTSSPIGGGSHNWGGGNMGGGSLKVGGSPMGGGSKKW
jgi:uncharacterized membrane protein YgcG